MKYERALLIVDMQNDFCPGGALGVPEGDKIITAVNRHIGIFYKKGLPIFLSRDWHPKKTVHFKKYGGAWPVHCIRDTKGADFHPQVRIPKRAIYLYKGMDPKWDSYSVFQAQNQEGLSFTHLLKILGVKELYIGGLATDYCVKFTGLDALRKGFKVNVLKDAIRGVNLRPQDSARAIALLVKKGARLIRLHG